MYFLTDFLFKIKSISTKTIRDIPIRPQERID